ncbi:general substrate transporter [Halenospora varia]|nr:general substrate transporter [Halenospora varia]
MAIFPQRKYFNQRLALSCSLIALSSFNYGFDNQAFATTQAMNAFTKQFGDYNAKKKTYALDPVWLSLFNSLVYIGFGAGVIIGSLISSRFGRRWCMFTMSLFALVTATISVTSNTREQIMAGRILNYLYVGMELSVVPVFQAEIVPAPIRGFIVGTYQLSLILGGLIINCVCRGTSGLPDSRAWRIPIGLFYIIPTIIASLILFVPESPRWLLTKGRIDEARANLQLLREGPFTDEEIDEQFSQLQVALEIEQEKGNFKEIFQGINRRRTLLVIGLNFFQQATGQAFASQYGAIYIKSLGTVNAFDMTLANGFINLFTISFVLIVTDRIGRRPLLLAGAAIQTAALMTMGGLGTSSPVIYSEKIGIVSMISVMAFGFSIGWGPLTYVVSTELPALRLRDYTLRVGFVANVIINFAVTFSIPYLLNAPYANLGSKVGFIFGALAVLAALFTWFFVPEGKGKSLEQIDRLFVDGTRVRDFGTMREEGGEDIRDGDISGIDGKRGVRVGVKEDV